MSRRLELHKILVELLGSRNVYFQPPTNLQMSYPCIVYSRTAGIARFGDNDPYTKHYRYQVTYIDKNPDSDMIDKLSSLRMCTYDRGFKSENLNHDIYSLYY